jgi:hypothetical protein
MLLGAKKSVRFILKWMLSLGTLSPLHLHFGWYFHLQQCFKHKVKGPALT